MVVPAKGQGQDRVAVIRTTEAVVLVVADGSGGMRGGAEAAEHAVRMISNAAQEMIALDTQSFVSLITRIDTAPAPGQGQCALVVAAIVGPRIVGASAGDCGAWLITESINDLTERQVRKPLVGSGSAAAVPFEAELGAATLLLASDGLLKYAQRNQIAALARDADVERVAHQLAQLPRLRSGELQDDLAIIVCRRKS
jgi:serine/threonine protein phosphatase PrpC